MRKRKSAYKTDDFRHFTPVLKLGVRVITMRVARRRYPHPGYLMADMTVKERLLDTPETLVYDLSVKNGLERYTRDQHDLMSNHLAHSEHSTAKDYATLEDIESLLVSFEVTNPQVRAFKTVMTIASVKKQYPHLFHGELKSHVIHYNETLAVEASNVRLSPIFLYEQPDIWVDQPNTLEKIHETQTIQTKVY